MADTYAQLVNSGVGRNLAKKLGLPQPAVLRRYEPGQPLVTGPVVVLGDTPGADKLAAELLSWDLDVRRHAVPWQGIAGSHPPPGVLLQRREWQLPPPGGTR